MLTANEKKYCTGLIHLRAQLNKLLDAEGHDQPIHFFDGEDWDRYFSVETASEQCAGVDGITRYRIGGAVLQVIYDGPYSDDNGDEIISDCNDRASEILDV